MGDAAARHGHALKGILCFLPAGVAALKSIEPCRPVGVMHAHVLDMRESTVAHRPSRQGDRFSWFLIDYRGSFNVTDAGDFAFRLVSADGSMLWVDDHLLIDNDGLHDPLSKSTTIHLDGGKHGIRIEYFKGDRKDAVLQLFVTPPNGAERLWTSEL